MMARKQWFEILLITEKTICIYAEDEDEAREKAENKYEPLWTIESVHPKDASPQSRGE